MKIFYELNNYCWNNVEENFLNTDIDIWCFEFHGFQNYENFKEKITNRKCIIYHSDYVNDELLMGIITRFIDDMVYFNELKSKFVSAIGNDKDIVLLVEGFDKKAFLQFFRQLQSEMNFNLNIIVGVHHNSESDTYHQLLRQVSNLDRFNSACIFNYNELSKSSKAGDMYISDKIICSELPKVLKKLNEKKYKGFAIYNHKKQNYEKFYISDSYINDDKIFNMYFYENVAYGHDKDFCKRLKKYKKEFARKYGIEYKTINCHYNNPCKGTCIYCEDEASSMWKRVYKNLKLSDEKEISVNGIERLRENIDGKGIRSLVILAGCPFNCLYCGNSEFKDIFLGSEKFTVSELGSLLEKDGIYFEQTGGGVTFGGGEPLLQSDFIKDFCNKYDMWKVDIETTLNADLYHIEKLINFIDVWHIDIKDMNSNIYRSYAGSDNKQIIENLKFLIDKLSAEKIHIRVPEIPNFNNISDMEKSVNILKSMGFTWIEKFKYKI